jgi:hypothetical protein
MRTPAGKECKFFYGDYYRGRQREECRLLGSANLRWQPSLCESCPVPGILNANACQNLMLTPSLKRPFPFIRQQVAVSSYCLQSKKRDFDAHVGCGECHSLPEVFTKTT